jgi:hypothetical protein
MSVPAQTYGHIKDRRSVPAARRVHPVHEDERIAITLGADDPRGNCMSNGSRARPRQTRAAAVTSPLRS